jgi:hypothetical protein
VNILFYFYVISECLIYFFLVPFQDLVTEVQYALYLTLSEFTGHVEDESDLEGLIEQQFEVLQKAFKIFIHQLGPCFI